MGINKGQGAWERGTVVEGEKLALETGLAEIGMGNQLLGSEDEREMGGTVGVHG